MSLNATAPAVTAYSDVHETVSDTGQKGPWTKVKEYFRLVGPLMLMRAVIRALDMIGLAYAVHSVTVPFIHLRLSVPYDEQIPNWVPLIASGHAGTLYSVVHATPLIWFLLLGTPRALTADWFQYWTARRSLEFAQDLQEGKRFWSGWFIRMRYWIENQRGWPLLAIVWVLKANPFPVGPPFHAASVAGTTGLTGRAALRVLVFGAFCKLLFIYGLVHIL